MGNADARLHIFARIGVLIVLLICAVALAGWFLGIPDLARIVPGWPRMAIVNALCFLLCAAAVFQLTLPAKARYLDPLRRVAAALVLTVGGYTLVRFLAEGGLNGVPAASTGGGIFSLGRPSLATALDFLLAAAALMLPRGPRPGRIYGWLIALGLAVAGLVLVGYAYGIAILSREPTVSSMSLPTLISFILLFLSALMARPGDGWMAVVLARDSGGIAARRFLPAVLVLPFVMDGMVVLAYRSRPFEAPFGFAILAVIMSAGLAIITMVIAGWLARHEEERRRDQELLEAIVENSEAVIYVKDLSGRYVRVNRRYLDIFHLDRQAVIGKTDRDLFPPSAAAAFRAMDERVARSGRPLIEEETAPHHDGPHTYVSMKSALRDAEGRPYAIFGISTDITERKLFELRLQTQLERLALLERITRAVGQRQDMGSILQVVVRSLEDRLPADFACICIYDPVQDKLTVNHVGINSAPLGRELGIIEQAVIPVDQNGLSRCVRGLLVYEPDIAEVDFPFPRRLARQGLRSLVFTPLAIEEKVFGVLVIARAKENAFSSTDCEFLRQLGEHVALAANQAQLHDSLQSAYNDLKQTQQIVLQQERLRALGQMASGIAHDINNAISPVAIYTQSLLERERDLPPRIHDYLEIVGRVIKDVSATVGRMRDFYRRGEPETALQAVNLNELVPQVVELTRARWSDMPQQRGIVITVVTELEPDLPAILGNPSEIREIATNLIFNAVDAMPQGGTITIRTASVKSAGPGVERVLFEVGDSGVGMEEETRRRCLEPFFTTKGERGTGLGLAMVYGAAQRHQATLDIDSAPGEGTRIRLTFRATQAEVAVQPAPRTGDIAPLRLLLVDDDPSVLHSTQMVLELDGHSVVAADGGAAGIDALRAAKEAGERFDMMVTDLGMPYVDGNQVARAAKELFPSLTVVLLTGWGRKMAGRDGSPTHVDHMLPKPLDIEELRALFPRQDE
ncbi:MAG TPA: PAS domain-containing protein [Rhizomicrobium sp.]|nr:PAS domain-containing protein [Rhizomicrobium sp.]